MAQMSQAGDLTSGPMLKKIILFSLPLAASSFLQLLFNAADVVVVGRFAGGTGRLEVVGSGAFFQKSTVNNLIIGVSKGYERKLLLILFNRSFIIDNIL